MSQYDTVDWKAMVGHRILVAFMSRVYDVILREVSPEGEYGRLEYIRAGDSSGKQEWVPLNAITSVEDLTNNPTWEEKGAKNA